MGIRLEDMVDQKVDLKDLKWSPPEWAAPAKDPDSYRTLVLTSADGKTSTHRLGDKAYVIIGRRDPTGQAEIFLEAPLASRNHAAIFQNAKGKYYIVDLDSANGTYLGKDERRLIAHRFEEWSLMDNKRVRFGANGSLGSARLKPADYDANQAGNQATKTAYKIPSSPKAHKNVRVPSPEPATNGHSNGTRLSVKEMAAKYEAEMQAKQPSTGEDMTMVDLKREHPNHVNGVEPAAKRSRALDRPSLGLVDDESQRAIGPQLPESHSNSNGHSNGHAVGNGYAKAGPMRSEVDGKSNGHQRPEKLHGHANGKPNGHVIGPSLPADMHNGRGGDRTVGPQLPSGGVRRQSTEGSHRFEKPGTSQANKVNPRDRERENGRSRTSVAGGGSSSSTTSGKVTCDKCDGPHRTEQCPHFKGGRDKHKDAWVNYGRKHPLEMGGNGGNYVLKRARLIRQPGDGSCLFHSLCYGLAGIGVNNYGNSAGRLRKELAEFINRNANLEIAGDTIEEWVKWDSRSSVHSYASRMSVSGWGGGIEMAACSRLKNVNIHVYQAKGNGYHRISCFDAPSGNSNTKTIHVCYQGGMHYDALAPF